MRQERGHDVIVFTLLEFSPRVAPLGTSCGAAGLKNLDKCRKKKRKVLPVDGQPAVSCASAHSFCESVPPTVWTIKFVLILCIPFILVKFSGFFSNKDRRDERDKNAKKMTVVVWSPLLPRNAVGGLCINRVSDEHFVSDCDQLSPAMTAGVVDTL